MPHTHSDNLVNGTVAPGFEEVAAEFRKNFTQRGDLGAACAIYHEGRKVVDLWGGHLDRQRRRPWQEDTLVLVFSITKGMAALAVALAHSRGLLDYDEKVATYWPEFAQHGKDRITVRQLLSHQAGLCALDAPLNPRVLADLDTLAELCARQKPAWEPGTRHGYHCFTLGMYQGELIRRVDPQRRSLGRFFQEEIARPLGMEFYIGLPRSVSPERLADIAAIPPLWLLLHLDTSRLGMALSYLNPRSLTRRAVGNPPLRSPADLGGPAYRGLELSSVNGIGQVRSIARACSAFATGGAELNLRPETLAALAAPAVPPTEGMRDHVLHADVCYGLGLFKPSVYFDFGSSPRAFGITGVGGSFCYADPDAQVGYAYAPNRMSPYPWNDPREKALRDAFSRCLLRMTRCPNPSHARSAAE